MDKDQSLINFLSRFQDHWVEQLLLPGAAIGFATAAMVVLRSFIFFFISVDAVPLWVVLFGVVVCLFTVYAANLVDRARAPILTHLVGIGVAAIVLIGLLWISRGTSSLLHINGYLPLSIVALGWFLSMSSGRRIARLGTLARSLKGQTDEERARIVEATTSSAGLAEARRKTAALFKRRTMTYTVAAALLAAVAFDQAHVWEPTWTVWRWSLAFGTAAMIFFGLVQQGALFLYELQITWSDAEGGVTSDFVERWVLSTFVLAASAVGVAMIIPARFALFDFRTTFVNFGEWFGRFMAQGVMLFNRYALGKSPGQLSGSSPMPSSGVLGFFEGATAGLAIVIALLATVVTAGIAIGAVMFFIRGEWRKLSGLLKVPALSYYWLRSALTYALYFLQAGIHWVGKLAGRVSALLKSTAPLPGQGRTKRRRVGNGNEEEDGALPDSYIRRLFVRLIRIATHHGLSPRKNQTPHEFAYALKQDLDDVDEDVGLLVDRYTQARYGRKNVEPSQSLEDAWDRVVDRIRGRQADG